MALRSSGTVRSMMAAVPLHLLRRWGRVSGGFEGSVGQSLQVGSPDCRCFTVCQVVPAQHLYLWSDLLHLSGGDEVVEDRVGVARQS